MVWRALDHSCKICCRDLTVPSVKGEIILDIKKTEERFSLKLNSPAETTAVVGIPQKVNNVSFIKRIACGEAVLWEGAKQKIIIPGIEHYDEDVYYIKFAVQPGVWVFEALMDREGS